MLKGLSTTILLLLSLFANSQTTLDTTFSQDGIVVHTRFNTTQPHPTQVNRMLVMADSSILLGCQTGLNPDGPMGIYGFVFCRLDKKGNILDTVTNQYSIYYKGYRYLMPPNNVSADWNGTRDLHLLPNNKVFLTGSVLNSAAVPFQATFRFNYPSLTLDTTYGIGGMGQLWQEKAQIADRTAFAPDGSSYTISNYLYSDSLFAFIVKRKPNGMLDSTWQTNGAFKYVNQKGGQFADIKVHTDGSIFVSGMYKDNALLFHAILLKFLPNGNPDPSFGTNGKAEAKYIARDIILNTDGSTYMIGSATFSQFTYQTYVIKYKPNGTPDSTFATNGWFINQSSFNADHLLKQPDNKILMIGGTSVGTDSAWISAMRLLPNGTIDNTFGVSGTYDMHERLLPSNNMRHANQGVLQSDGKLLIGGGTLTPNSPEMMVIRLNNTVTSTPPTTRITSITNNNFSFTASPIPARDWVHLHYTLTQSDHLIYSITDMSGRLLKMATLTQTPPGNYNQVINVGDLSTGMYLLKVQGTSSQETKALIIK